MQLGHTPALNDVDDDDDDDDLSVDRYLPQSVGL